MASIRQLKSGKWEVTIRHPQLPRGRKFFTFGTEEAARTYGEQWDLLVKAGLPIPQQLLVQTRAETGSLALVLRARANAPETAASEQATLGLLMKEVGQVKLDAVTYTWAENWITQLKTRSNLAPSSIRKRVGALSRAIDGYLRMVPDAVLANPLHLLPKRYSIYTERDAALVRAAGREPKTDIERDRRLESGEEVRILAALRGEKRADKQRGLEPSEAMCVLFLVLVYGGLRLKEAYTLRVDQVDLAAKVLRVRKSKLWHGKVAFKDVPIQPALYGPLKGYLHGRTGLLFPFWDGTEPERKVTNRLSQAFARAFAYAQCEGLTEHDLRHEATCRWLELRDKSGNWMFRPEEINRIMGWAPNSKMAQRYASFRGESLAARLWV